MSVVDYDARRVLAAANVAAEVQTVRSFVSKFTKAQRAAEQTLDMWDTPMRSVQSSDWSGVCEDFPCAGTAVAAPHRR